MLVIRKLLYVGNLHLPTFTYIQSFDRIFPNTFRNFSRWFPQEVAVIFSTFLGDFLNFSRWFLSESALISATFLGDFWRKVPWFLQEVVAIFGEFFEILLISIVQKLRKNAIFAKFLHDKNHQNRHILTKYHDSFLRKSRHFPTEIT